MTHREPDSVEPGLLTCQEVDERDLEAAYIAGRLTEDEALAFEAHVFECDRCWPALQTALAVRAAQPARSIIARARPRRAWWPLAAAAVATVVAGTWWISARDFGRGSPDAMRGGRDSIPVRATRSAQHITVQFDSFPGADRYRVRLYTESGALLAEREIGDTALEVPLPPDSAPAVIIVHVTALDVLRQTLASSGLVPLSRSPSP
jgi:hypothetical protein